MGLIFTLAACYLAIGLLVTVLSMEESDNWDITWALMVIGWPIALLLSGIYNIFTAIRRFIEGEE